MGDDDERALARGKNPQHEVGTFEVKADGGPVKDCATLIVSDPCYDPGTWCAVKVEKVCPGTWHAYTERQATGGWGKRISALEVRHASYTSAMARGHLTWSEEGNAGVDSGQCGIWRADTPLGQGEYGEPGFYGDACSATSWYPDDDELGRECGLPCGGMVGTFGVVSASGFGDGEYDVLVARDRVGGRECVVAVRVEYLDPAGDAIDELQAREAYRTAVLDKRRKAEEVNRRFDELCAKLDADPSLATDSEWYAQYREAMIDVTRAS